MQQKLKKKQKKRKKHQSFFFCIVSMIQTVVFLSWEIDHGNSLQGIAVRFVFFTV